MRDAELLPHIQQTAELIMREHQDIIPLLINRWLGEKFEYGKV